MNQLIIKKKNELTTNKKKGFTLVELIIVIAIIAILSAVAIPKFNDIREDANVKADIATAKSIQSAIAVEVTNGKNEVFIPSTSDTPTSITEDEVKTVLNGGVVPKPKAKKAKDGSFTATIDKNGNVVVLANSIQVLPNPVDPYK